GGGRVGVRERSIPDCSDTGDSGRPPALSKVGEDRGPSRSGSAYARRQRCRGAAHQRQLGHKIGCETTLSGVPDPSITSPARGAAVGLGNRPAPDVELGRLHWHIERYDRLRGSVASRASYVLSANALILGGAALTLNQLAAHEQGIVLRVAAFVVLVIVLTCVTASVWF